MREVSTGLSKQGLLRRAAIFSLCIIGSSFPLHESPYQAVIDKFANDGYEAPGFAALELASNLVTDLHDRNSLPIIMQGMEFAEADVIELSVRMQFSSLSLVTRMESRAAGPLITAPIPNSYDLLWHFSPETVAPGKEALLLAAC